VRLLGEHPQRRGVDAASAARARKRSASWVLPEFVGPRWAIDRVRLVPPHGQVGRDALLDPAGPRQRRRVGPLRGRPLLAPRTRRARPRRAAAPIEPGVQTAAGVAKIPAAVCALAAAGGPDDAVGDRVPKQRQSDPELGGGLTGCEPLVGVDLLAEEPRIGEDALDLGLRDPAVLAPRDQSLVEGDQHLPGREPEVLTKPFGTRRRLGGLRGHPNTVRSRAARAAGRGRARRAAKRSL
jgi:hypothetical protein